MNKISKQLNKIAKEIISDDLDYQEDYNDYDNGQREYKMEHQYEIDVKMKINGQEYSILLNFLANYTVEGQWYDNEIEIDRYGHTITETQFDIKNIQFESYNDLSVFDRKEREDLQLKDNDNIQLIQSKEILLHKTFKGTFMQFKKFIQKQLKQYNDYCEYEFSEYINEYKS